MSVFPFRLLVSKPLSPHFEEGVVLPIHLFVPTTASIFSVKLTKLYCGPGLAPVQYTLLVMVLCLPPSESDTVTFGVSELLERSIIERKEVYGIEIF